MKALWQLLGHQNSSHKRLRGSTSLSPSPLSDYHNHASTTAVLSSASLGIIPTLVFSTKTGEGEASNEDLKANNNHAHVNIAVSMHSSFLDGRVKKEPGERKRTIMSTFEDMKQSLQTVTNLQQKFSRGRCGDGSSSSSQEACGNLGCNDASSSINAKEGREGISLSAAPPGLRKASAIRVRGSSHETGETRLDCDKMPDMSDCGCGKGQFPFPEELIDETFNQTPQTMHLEALLESNSMQRKKKKNKKKACDSQVAGSQEEAKPQFTREIAPVPILIQMPRLHTQKQRQSLLCLQMSSLECSPQHRTNRGRKIKTIVTESSPSCIRHSYHFTSSVIPRKLEIRGPTLACPHVGTERPFLPSDVLKHGEGSISAMEQFLRRHCNGSILSLQEFSNEHLTERQPWLWLNEKQAKLFKENAQQLPSSVDYSGCAIKKHSLTKQTKKRKNHRNQVIAKKDVGIRSVKSSADRSLGLTTSKISVKPMKRSSNTNQLASNGIRGALLSKGTEFLTEIKSHGNRSSKWSKGLRKSAGLNALCTWDANFNADNMRIDALGKCTDLSQFLQKQFTDKVYLGSDHDQKRHESGNCQGIGLLEIRCKVPQPQGETFEGARTMVKEHLSRGMWETGRTYSMGGITDSEQWSPVSVLDVQSVDDIYSPRSDEICSPKSMTLCAINSEGLDSGDASARIGSNKIMFQSRFCNEASKEAKEATLDTTLEKEEDVELRYVKQMCSLGGVMEDPHGLLRRWQLNGHPIEDKLFVKLEEEEGWEEEWAMSMEIEEEDDEDRDYGGELYRKCMQGLLQRRLLFDCTREIVQRHLCSSIKTQDFVQGSVCLPKFDIGADMQILAGTSCHIKNILEKDLSHPWLDPWSSVDGLPTETSIIAQYAEDLVFSDLTDEVIEELLLF